MRQLEATEISEVTASVDDCFDIELEAPEHCPRYVGRVVRGIDPEARTPLWMQEKLRRCGLRPISPVVDVTNYVMMELGQPMHGFDFDKLHGGIRVRLADKGEKLALLDQSEVECADDTLLIADHKPVVLRWPGSWVGWTARCRRKRATFFSRRRISAPYTLRARRVGSVCTPTRHTVSSAASMRPCRRWRWNAPRDCCIDIAGGEAGPLIDSMAAEHMPSASAVSLRHSQAERLLGIPVESAEIESILGRAWGCRSTVMARPGR